MTPGRGRPADAERPVIVMAGPGPQSAGGVWSVMATILDSPLAERFDIVPVATHRDGPPIPKLWAGVRGIARVGRMLLSRRPPDLVWLHTASGFSCRRKAAIAVMARLRGVPHVVHLHGGEFHLWYRTVSRPERAVVRMMLRTARCVIALSPIWERRLREITPCPTVSVMNPVPIPPVAPRAPEPGAVVTTGRLGDDKGSRVLVRAAALLSGRGVGVHVHLAGDGDQEPVLREAQALGVGDRVTLHGWVGRPQVEALLDRARVFALPSRLEGMPVSMLEAMARSLPVVVTPVGGIPDVVEDGRQGLIVPPDDPEALAEALERLLTDPSAADAMGRAGREAVERRASIPVFTRRLGAILNRVLAG